MGIKNPWPIPLSGAVLFGKCRRGGRGVFEGAFGDEVYDSRELFLFGRWGGGEWGKGLFLPSFCLHYMVLY